MLGRFLKDLLQGRSPGLAPSPDPGPPHAANPLAEYFFANSGRLIFKWHHYFDIYHHHFQRFRGQRPVVVEIGVSHGGSLQMWHDYFGPGTRVVGIDVDERCRQFEDENTTMLIGDQADRTFLTEVRRAVPRIDIVIDDGGHQMAQQITTFEMLYPHVQSEGVYLCEDVHTSFMPEYGGGYRRAGTYLEFSKALVDRLYAWYSKDSSLTVDDFTLSTHGMHFYDSIVVVEKRPMAKPVVTTTGVPAF